MSRNFIYTVMIAALAAFTTAELPAQEFGGSHPGNDVLSISVYGGGFTPTATFQDGTEFDNTGTVGGTLTFWAHRYVGIRGNVLWAQPDVSVRSNDAALLGEDPNTWLYNGDVLLRLPLPAGATGTFYPYLVGGLGAKTYDWETTGSDTDFAGNVGAGVEYRFGSEGTWGVHAEVRDFISSFDRAGLDATENDLVWTGGISLNF